tara:strand:+ start:348 stop:623 length:276 start_codon:yes stop_codon:yes gene_type:complete
MKKLSLILGTVAIFISLQMLVPNTSEAGVTCSTDVWGNYNCRETGNFSGNSWSSSTRTDVWGNDVTTFNNGFGQTQTMSCRTDVWGNYVCN